MITKEQAISMLSEDELFCLIGEGWQLIKEKLVKQNEITEDLTLLDKDLYDIVKGIKKDVEKSNYLGKENISDDEDRSCTKCGKTLDLINNEDMCKTCARERGRI